MMATPKQELHELVERLSDDEAQRLSAVLRRGDEPFAVAAPRPLALTDIVLSEPLMPDDESADDLIETVRRWRREGGYA